MHRIPDEPADGTDRMILVRIITRRDWDILQGWHRHYSGSKVEHLYAGLYVLTIPPADEEAA
jgi:hypothetical protein